MNSRFSRLCTLAALLCVSTAGFAAECIAPANPGGGWDFTCRQIGKIMYDIGAVEKPIQVTNMAGAGGGLDLLIYGGFFFIQPKYMNLMYRRTTLRAHGFESTYTGIGFVWVWFSNILFIVFTLGLFLPFAKVRLTKYLTENVTLKVKGSLDDFTAGEAEKVSALGQEVGTAFDFDLGIGI